MAVWIWLSIGVDLVEVVVLVDRCGFGGSGGGVDLGEVVVDRCGLVEVFQIYFFVNFGPRRSSIDHFDPRRYN